MYKAKPIDTSEIVLGEELLKLVEQLAQNTHEVWAGSRLSEGWSYGEKRNDEKKLHPCLVPYDELPESEKDYDRNTSMETLKLIMKQGYLIIKGSG